MPSSSIHLRFSIKCLPVTIIPSTIPTGPQKVLTIKLTSFAFNVYDGRRWDSLFKTTGDKRKDRINESRRK